MHEYFKYVNNCVRIWGEQKEFSIVKARKPHSQIYVRGALTLEGEHFWGIITVVLPVYTLVNLYAFFPIKRNIFPSFGGNVQLFKVILSIGFIKDTWNFSFLGYEKQVCCLIWKVILVNVESSLLNTDLVDATWKCCRFFSQVLFLNCMKFPVQQILIYSPPKFKAFIQKSLKK